MKPRETVPHSFFMFELTVSSTRLQRRGKSTFEKGIVQPGYDYSIRFREVIAWTFISMYLFWIGDKTFFFLSEGHNFIGKESKPFLQLQYFRQISLFGSAGFPVGGPFWLVLGFVCYLLMKTLNRASRNKQRLIFAMSFMGNHEQLRWTFDNCWLSIGQEVLINKLMSFHMLEMFLYQKESPFSHQIRTRPCNTQSTMSKSNENISSYVTFVLVNVKRLKALL